MSQFEYKVVPAPAKGLKAKGIKTPEERFANALQVVMNDMGADGWEYLRADILPSEERQGLRGSHTVYRSMLVFRRAQDATPDAATETVVMAAPVAVVPEPAQAAPTPTPDPEIKTEDPDGTNEAPERTSLWSRSTTEASDIKLREPEPADPPLTRS